MANAEHVEHLKRSIREWNRWREEQRDIRPDLSSADLCGADLCGADLRSVELTDANLTDANLTDANLIAAELCRADLRGAKLCGAGLDRTNLIEANLVRVDLSRVSLWGAKLHSADLIEANLCGAHLAEANLSGAYLSGANLVEANLHGANLIETNLSSANLSGANLHGANLGRTNLYRANLSRTNFLFANLGRANLRGANLSLANLCGSDLTQANLGRVNLYRANFEEAIFGWTLFEELDLNEVKGLETARYEGPSTVNINSVILPSDEQVRVHFLRGVGFTETQIEYLPSLLTPRPIEYHSLFISYAHQDEALAQQLYAYLRKQNVPCWFAPHNMRPGNYVRERIDQAIHTQDKLLLLLSEHSVNSGWVHYEVEQAIARENSQQREVLFPLRLDDAIFSCIAGWAASLRATRHIGDFTGWQDEQRYQEACATLLRHLKAEKP